MQGPNPPQPGYTGPTQVMPQRQPPRRSAAVPIWVLLALVALFSVVCGVIWSYVYLTRPTATSLQPTASAVFSVVTAAAPATETPNPTLILVASETPVLTPTLPAGPVGEISIGTQVQVVGTGTDGLRLRQGAGLDFPVNYLGIEYEVFTVLDGPQQVDDFTWWFLVAPDDDTRNGWAVENFLEVAQGQ